jgi:hypothetical protein
MRAFSVGPAIINDLWLIVDGARVNNGDSVAPGKQFTIMASFEANNASTGVVNQWSICITAIDSTRTIKNYRTKDSSFSVPSSKIASSSLEINAMGNNVMPDSNLTLTVKIWGSDQIRPATEYPDISLW